MLVSETNFLEGGEKLEILNDLFNLQLDTFGPTILRRILKGLEKRVLR